MNKELFAELYKFINSPALSEEQFFNYLTSDNLISSSYNYKYFTKKGNTFQTTCPDIYIRIIKSSQNFSLDNLMNYMSHTESSIKQRLLSLQNQKKIVALYAKYQPELPCHDNPEQLLLNLFRECITEKTYLFPSYKKQYLKPKTMAKIAGRENDCDELKRILNQHKHILLSGELGCGKTRFIEYYISKEKPEDCYYVSYQENLNTTLGTIKFDHSYFNNGDISMLKNQKYKDALLVIDNMQFSKDIKADLKELSSYAIQVVAITANNTSSSDFRTFKLSDLSDDDICNIFELYSEITLSNPQRKELCTISKKNVLLVSLIAGLCKKLNQQISNSTPQNKIIDIILSKMKKSIDIDTKKDQKIDLKYKHTYDKENLGLIGHIKAAYRAYYENINDTMSQFLEYLCCFGWSPIPMLFTEEIFTSTFENAPSYNNIQELIADLAEWNLIKITDNHILISPLIVHAVIATHKPVPEKMTDIIENLCNFLTNYSDTLSVPYLSDTLFRFVQTLYDDVKTINNATQITTSKIFEKWQDLLYLIWNYYQYIGSFNLANEISNLIKYPDELQSKYNSWENKLFNLSMNIHTHATNELVSQIDNMTDTPQDNVNAIAITNFYISMFNHTLKQLFENELQAYLNTNSVLVKPDNIAYLRKGMGQIISHSNLPENRIFFSDEQISFFNLCYWLLYKNYHLSGEYPKDFIDSYNSIDSWKNVNLQIQGTAYILYRQNRYCYCKQDFPIFANSVLLKTETLNKLINNCNLIPGQTFYLCFYVYILVAATHFAFQKVQNKTMPVFPLTEYIYSLLERTIIAQEELINIMETLNSVLNSLNLD